VAASAQLALPLWTAWRQEAAAAWGTAYTFEAGGFDPADVMRGRYVRIRLQPMAAPLEEGQSVAEGDTIYALPEEGPTGLAGWAGVRMERPAQGDYVATRATHAATGPGEVTLDLPTRFYMREDLAEEAQRQVLGWQPPEREPPEIRVEARVREGVLALQQLTIDGTPIAEYVRSLAGDEAAS
jgi:hypothetical protein